MGEHCYTGAGGPCSCCLLNLKCLISGNRPLKCFQIFPLNSFKMFPYQKKFTVNVFMRRECWPFVVVLPLGVS